MLRVLEDGILRGYEKGQSYSHEATLPIKSIPTSKLPSIHCLEETMWGSTWTQSQEACVLVLVCLLPLTGTCFARAITHILARPL